MTDHTLTTDQLIRIREAMLGYLDGGGLPAQKAEYRDTLFMVCDIVGPGNTSFYPYWFRPIVEARYGSIEESQQVLKP
jgi:hypothetical protein